MWEGDWNVENIRTTRALNGDFSAFTRKP